MSRVGRLPITIPSGVAVDVTATTSWSRAPRAPSSATSPHSSRSSREDGQLRVERPNDDKRSRELHGLTRTLINNMVVGVTEGYRRGLEIQGVGYRAQLVGRKLQLNLGYSHPIEIDPPEGITFEVENPTRVAVTGIDKELVGQHRRPGPGHPQA